MNPIDPFARKKVPYRVYRITTVSEFVEVNLEEDVSRVSAIKAALDHSVVWNRDPIDVGYKVVTLAEVSQEDLNCRK